jgi:uncharacterized protein YjbI with pentapeptide repeats
MGVDLMGVDLMGVDLMGVDLMGVDLMGVDLMGVDLMGVDLMGVDLMGMDLMGMDLMRFWEVALFVNIPHRTSAALATRALNEPLLRQPCADNFPSSCFHSVMLIIASCNVSYFQFARVLDVIFTIFRGLAPSRDIPSSRRV